MLPFAQFLSFIFCVLNFCKIICCRGQTCAADVAMPLACSRSLSGMIIVILFFCFCFHSLRGPTGAADVVMLLAIVFNSDNGGLFVGSLSKMFVHARPSRPSDQHHHLPHQRQRRQQGERRYEQGQTSSRPKRDSA